MFRLECPNCRQPLSRNRVALAWHKLRCPHCNSVLAVDRNRNAFGLIPAIVVMLLLFRVFHITDYSMFIAFPLCCAAGYTCALPFIRVRLVTPSGIRCRKCGYDLRAQTVLRCPECGTPLDPDATVRDVELDVPAVRTGGHLRLLPHRITIALAFGLTAAALAILLIHYTRWTAVLGHPHSLWIQLVIAGLTVLIFLFAIALRWHRA